MDGCELDNEDGSFETGFGCADIRGLDIGSLKIGALETWLSTCFPDLKMWTVLHYFSVISSASWIGKEFFGLGKG